MEPESIVEKVLGEDGLLLSLITKQTEKMCIIAVKQNFMALEYVINQTKEICLLALEINENAINYVKDENMLYELIKFNSYLLGLLREQSVSLCEKIVLFEPLALQYVNEQTEEMCINAIEKNIGSVKYINDITENIAMAILKKDIYYAKYIRNRTEKINRYIFEERSLAYGETANYLDRVNAENMIKIDIVVISGQHIGEDIILEEEVYLKNIVCHGTIVYHLNFPHLCKMFIDKEKLKLTIPVGTEVSIHDIKCKLLNELVIPASGLKVKNKTSFVYVCDKQKTRVYSDNILKFI